MPSLSDVAHHEAGHAVAAALGFRSAAWLPLAPPAVPVRSVEIVKSEGRWTGCCTATNIYSTRWNRVSQRYRDLMERQVAIHLGGGLAEAIHRGERRKEEILQFATQHCCADVDLRRAAPVLADLLRLGGDSEQRIVEKTLGALLTNWAAVEAVAAALIKSKRVEGAQVEAIIDASLIG